jgi:phage-related protein
MALNGPKIGDAFIRVHATSKGLDRDARKAARGAGEEWGEEFSSGLDDTLEKRGDRPFDRMVEKTQAGYRDALRKMEHEQKSFESSSEASRREYVDKFQRGLVRIMRAQDDANAKTEAGQKKADEAFERHLQRIVRGQQEADEKRIASEQTYANKSLTLLGKRMAAARKDLQAQEEAFQRRGALQVRATKEMEREFERRETLVRREGVQQVRATNEMEREFSRREALYTRQSNAARKREEQITHVMEREFTKRLTLSRKQVTELRKHNIEVGDAIRAMAASMRSLGDDDTTNMAWERAISRSTASAKKDFVDLDETIAKVAKNSKHHDLFGGNGMFGSIDKEMQLIIAAVIAGFGELSALSSGFAASLTAIIGSVVTAASGAALALGGMGVGIAYAFALAKTSLTLMEDKFPKTQAALEHLKTAFMEVDVPTFAEEWSGSLEKFANTLADSLTFDTVAENLGEATAGITDAFTKLLESKSWVAFVDAIEGPISNGIEGLGIGFAGAMEGVLGLLAAAAPLAEALGNMFGQWGTEFAKSMEDIGKDEKFKKFMDDSLTAIDAIFDILGPLKDGLLNVFLTGADEGNGMLGVLGRLAQEFSDWTSSVEGQKSLNEWFAAGRKIFDALIPLIGAVGDMFADLITPDLIDRTVDFMGNLAEFLPFLGEALEVFSNLGIFDLLSEALLAIGTALEPVFPVLQDLATLLSDTFSDVLIALQPVLNTLGQGLADVIIQIVPLLGELAETFIGMIETLAPAYEEAFPLLVQAFIDLLLSLTPILPELLKLIPKIAELAAEQLPILVEFLTLTLFPALEKWGPFLLQITEKVVERLIPAMDSMLQTLRDDIIPFLDTKLFPALKQMSDDFDTAYEAVTFVVDIIAELYDGMKAGMDMVVDFLVEWGDFLLDMASGEDIIKSIKELFDDLGDAWDDAVDKIENISWPTPPKWLTEGVGDFVGNLTPWEADGTVAYGPQVVGIGEAGPEAVVPLNRPLSMVDPSVRWLSAIAQGKTPMMASGGVVSGGITITEGAIQVVVPGTDPHQAASAMMDRFVALAHP